MTGFTGVVWDTRTTERLAHELGDGAGPAPLIEAGRAWTAVAAEFASAGAEYASIMTALGTHWRSAYTGSAFEKLTELAPWFAQTATAAADNAVRAETQAAAVSVARLSMPNLAEVDIAQSAMHAATSLSALAPAMVGAAARAERAVHDQRMRASRVMQSYESATEPAARPWENSVPAPNLVSGASLAAERAAREAAARAAATARTAGAPVAGPLPLAGMSIGMSVAPEKSRYAPTVVAAAAATTPVVASPVATTSTPHAPMAPFAPQMGVASSERIVARGPEAEEAVAENTETGVAGESAASPTTWAELAVAEKSAVQPVPVADPDHDAVRHDSAFLTLDAPREN